MTARTRNLATGTWHRRERLIDTDQGYLIDIEQADMHDTKIGKVYVGGAYRVTLRGIPGMRTKTFLGESAWSDAARYAADAATAMGDWRWWPNL